MELTIFPKPKITAELTKYVEVRLHLDAKNLPAATVERHQAYQKQTTRSTGIPTYIIVDPAEPDVVLGRFDGFDLTLGTAFRDFLAKNAGP